MSESDTRLITVLYRKCGRIFHINIYFEEEKKNDIRFCLTFQKKN